MNPYETWVRTIRAWVADEKVSLENLPSLTEESLPREAFDRLLVHLQRALEQVTDQWAAKLQTVLQDLPEPRQLSVELLRLRKGLARTLELARHPGLPARLREALTIGIEGSIRRHQQEVERAVQDLWKVNPGPLAEQYILAVRQHSFVSVIGYVSERAGGRMSAVHTDTSAAARQGQTDVLTVSRGRRIIFES